MKFLIRDDDTCGMTRVEDLENCYKSIWGHIPVCLSVTPFRIPSIADWIPEEYFARQDPVVLGENGELIDFLKAGLEKKWLDVALHGYHHVITDNDRAMKLIDRNDPRQVGREYLYGDHLDVKTREGKNYLESTLGYRVNTFVPPGNAISKNGLRAIIEQGLNIVGIYGLGLRDFNQRPFDPYRYLNTAKRALWKIMHPDCTIYPFPIHFADGHKEIDYSLLYPSTDLTELKKKLDFVYSVNGVFILATHYHAFHKKIRSGETMKDALRIIIDHVVKKNNVEFVTYRELWG